MTLPAAPGALVLGATYRAVGVVQSLGRRRVPAWVVPTDDHRIGALSRYARRMPCVNGDGLAEALVALARRGLRGAVVIPTGDGEALCVSRHHERLSRDFRLSVMSMPDIGWAYDKRETYRLAGGLGLAHPRTWLPGDARALAGLDLPFPVIVKPAYRPPAIAPTSPKAWRASDRRELEAAWAAAEALIPPERIMIQELIAGGGDSQLAYGALCRSGEVLVSVAARRARQRPMDFGQSSTFVETIDEREVAQPAVGLLRATNYTGLVEVEFKRSSRDGSLRLLDVNARTWGWMSVGARAGADFPYLLWRMLTDGSVPRVRARPGVRWVRLATDGPTAAQEVLAGRMGMGAWARSMRPRLAHAVFTWSDPLPGLYDPVELATIALRRTVRCRAR